MGAGSALVIAAIAASGSSESRARAGEVMAPRPSKPTACASSSSCATGPGCSRADQRGRRQIIARDASAASTDVPVSNSASVLSNSRRSSGAAVEYSESDSAAKGLPSGPRCPIRLGRAGRSCHVLASRCHRSAAGASTKRSAATVGAQNGPSGPSSGSGSGMPLAMRPAPDAISRISARRLSAMPVCLASRFISRIPSPPLRSSGTGVAPRVSITTSSSRSRSMMAPAPAASTAFLVTGLAATTGWGAVNSAGAGASPRSSWPT